MRSTPFHRKHSPATRVRKTLLTTLAVSTLAVTLGAADIETAAAPAADASTQLTAAPTAQSQPAHADAEMRPAAAQGPAGRANVLLVTLDDAAHGDFKYMPYTRHLVADQGVTMTDFVAPTPICVPSRTSTLTGNYAHNTHLVTVGGPRGTADYFADSGQNRDALPVWLDRAGYDTFQTGKWMNGYERALPASRKEPGWDRWEPSTLGTYNFFRTGFFDNGRVEVNPGQYSTYAITDRATSYIKSKRTDRDPWFAWINYVAPHHGSPSEADDPVGMHTTVAAPQDRNRFDGVKLPKQPNMWKAAPGSYGQNISRTGRISAAFRSGAREVFEQRIESLQAIDRGIRDQVEALRESGQLANTYIMVTSDNGYSTGQHNLVGKLFPYREINYVPMVIRGPGVPRDKVVRSTAAIPDLAVTIAAIGNAEPSSGKVDGTNFLPLLTDERTLGRPIPIEAYRMGTSTGQYIYWGVIDGPWVYAKFRGHQELYNKQKDPYQVRNLVNSARYQDKVRELRRLAKDLKDCAGDTCPKEFEPVS